MWWVLRLVQTPSRHVIALPDHRNEDRGLALFHPLPVILGDCAFGNIWERIRKLEKQLQSIRNFQGKKVFSDGAQR